MKNLKIIIMISIFLSMQSLQAEQNTSVTESITTGSEFEPQTDDKLNAKLLNTLPAVNILNLSGVDFEGLAIKRFVVHTLPNARAGILYLADGETKVISNQYLSLEEADALRFDPNENFEGRASFTYASIDSREMIDSSPATVILPIVAPTVVAVTNSTTNKEDCEAYESSIPSLSTFGLFILFILSLYIATSFMKKEL